MGIKSFHFSCHIVSHSGKLPATVSARKPTSSVNSLFKMTLQRLRTTKISDRIVKDLGEFSKHRDGADSNTQHLTLEVTTALTETIPSTTAAVMSETESTMDLFLLHNNSSSWKIIWNCSDCSLQQVMWTTQVGDRDLRLVYGESWRILWCRMRMTNKPISPLLNVQQQSSFIFLLVHKKVLLFMSYDLLCNLAYATMQFCWQSHDLFIFHLLLVNAGLTL